MWDIKKKKAIIKRLKNKLRLNKTDAKLLQATLVKKQLILKLNYSNYFLFLSSASLKLYNYVLKH